MKKILLIAALSVLNIISCSSGNSGGEDSIENHHGIWYNRENICEQGIFSSELRITDNCSIDGTITLNNHSVGTITVHGEYSEEYSTYAVKYHTIDLYDDSGNITLNANDQNGYGYAGVINYNSQSGAKQYVFYTGDQEAVTISGCVQTELSEIQSISVKPDGSIIAYGKENSEDEFYSLYKLNSDGTISGEPYSSETYLFHSGIFDYNEKYLWFIKETTTIDEYGFEEYEYNLYKVDENDFTIESQNELTCYTMGDYPFSISYSDNYIYTLYGFVVTNIAKLDTDANLIDSYPGVIDALSISVAANKVYFLKTGRSCDNFIAVSNLDGSDFKSFFAPGDTTNCIKIVNDTVYFSTNDGWILTVPVAELD